MAPPSPLRIGGRISSETGAAQGRIGGFATHPNGRLFALVARHVAYAEPNGRIFQVNEDIGAATELAIDSPAWKPEAPNLAAAIAAVDITKLGRPIIIEEAGISVTSCYDEPMDVLDKRVRTLTDADDFAEGTVVWVGTRTRINFGEGHAPIHYVGAVEIDFDAKKGNGLGRGDAGMPIVDLHGRLVGLAISGGGTRCFVAPVAPFLKQYNLSLFGQNGVAAPVEVTPSFDLVTAGLRDASANLANWMRESTRQPGLFTRMTDGSAALIIEEVE